MYHNLSILQLLNIYAISSFLFDCFFAISYSAAISIALWCFCTNISLGYIYLGMELMGLGNISVQFIVVVPQLYSKWFLQLHIFSNTSAFLILGSEMKVKWELKGLVGISLRLSISYIYLLATSNSFSVTGQCSGFKDLQCRSRKPI